MRISDWSSDVCSSDLTRGPAGFDYVLATFPYSYVANFGFVVVPLFMFMSQMAFVTGMSRRAFESANIKIGRASCRERVCQYVSISVVAVSLKKKDASTIQTITNQVINKTYNMI